MSWDAVWDALGAVLLALGASLTLVAGLAVARFRDLLSRMHAATKPQVLGLVLVVTGVAVSLRDPVVTWTLLLVIAFQLVTAPISAHMVGRAGYRTGKLGGDVLETDELTDDLAATRALLDQQGEDGAGEHGAAEDPVEDGGGEGRAGEARP